MARKIVMVEEVNVGVEEVDHEVDKDGTHIKYFN